jgi:hypothetical protein
MACVAYGVRNPVDAQKWLDSMDKTSGACGLMHMTYYDDYDDIESFADIIHRRKK